MKSFAIFLTLPSLVFAHSMDSAREAGKSLGHSGASQAISQIQHFPSNELLPEEPREKLFDPEKAQEEAKKCTKNGEYVPASTELDYLRSKEIQNNRIVLGNESFLEHAENISQNAEIKNIGIEESLEITIETCQQSDAPYPISLIRDLQVEVIFNPGESKEIKICLRHNYDEKFQYKKDAEKKVKELKKSLSQDPTIKWYQVSDPEGGGLFHRYCVEAHWEHHEDAQTCDRYQTQLKVIREPKYEEIGEIWVYEDANLLSLSKTPHCTFVKSECLDSTPSKSINGKEVNRQCWKEKLTFLCNLRNSNECPYIKNQNCELVKKECLKEGPYGCALWELTFKCTSKMLKRHLGENAFYGLDEKYEYQPNDAFSEVAAKLAVFEEIKKELENEQVPDARAVQVFRGKKMQCSKSIADTLMYDCCFNYSGLAKELGLKNCNADEIALSEMRENGLCHYVGSYAGEFLDLWKSRDEHVFCCFGSKLARLLQENARGQLAIGWDHPKHANCRGLSLAEISRLDFTAMDFSELYADFEKKLPENFQSKLEAFENKIKEKTKEHV
jgi:conjugal transfer mating pair stabilization protein TraN